MKSSVVYFVANTAIWALATVYMMAAARGMFGQTHPLMPLGMAVVGLAVSVIFVLLSWRRMSWMPWLMIVETLAGISYQLLCFKMILYVA